MKVSFNFSKKRKEEYKEGRPSLLGANATSTPKILSVAQMLLYFDLRVMTGLRTALKEILFTCSWV